MPATQLRRPPSPPRKGFNHGLLGHLGPIDPQLDGLPALGVSQALETLAQLAQTYPGSSEMFARFLRMAIRVEHIGYSERICKSAVQYADRLLQTKQSESLPKPAGHIAHDLVHEYKDHGFVIDYEEARSHLGDAWIRTDTPELALAEEVYTFYEQANLFLQFAGDPPGRYIALGGNLERPVVLQRRSR